MKKFAALIIILSYIEPAQAQTDTSMIELKPSHPHILYTGRTYSKSKDDVSFSYPGVSIKMKFTGDAIDMLLQDMGTEPNYFNVIIDNNKPIVILTTAKQYAYPLARKLDLKEHTIEIIKRTESSVGTVILYGFRLRNGNKLLPVTDVPERKIEFIGNSITAGYGNELSIPAPPEGNPSTGFKSKNENNYTAWGAVTSRALKARYVCTAYSGRGVYRNNTGNFDGTLPLIYDYVIPDKTDAVWDHKKFVPDVIVVDLGTNDFAPGNPDSTAFCTAYVSFIEKLRGIHPQTKIVCVAGNMQSDSWPPGANSWTRMRNYLNSIVKKANDKGNKVVYYFELTPQSAPYGEDWHPSNATHQKMADAITPFIKTISGW